MVSARHDADHAPRPGEVCASCATPLQGRFCHACGERRHDPAHDHSLLAIVEHAIEGFTHLDGRFLRTFARLLFRPGSLTDDHLHGRRVQVMAPMPLFLVICVVFYLCFTNAYVQTRGEFASGFAQHDIRQNLFLFDIEGALAERAARGGRTVDGQWEIAAEKASHYSKLFMGSMAPVWALGIWALFRRRWSRLVPHLVFAVHALGVFLILDLLFLGGIRLWQLWRGVGEVAIGGLDYLPLVVPFLLHTAFAMRRVYRQSWLATGIKALLGTAMLLLLIIVYRQVVTIVAVRLS